MKKEKEQAIQNGGRPTRCYHFLFKKKKTSIPRYGQIIAFENMMVKNLPIHQKYGDLLFYQNM